MTNSEQLSQELEKTPDDIVQMLLVHYGVSERTIFMR